MANAVGDERGFPGDHVTLLARMDLVAACSACPQDLAPTNAGKLSDLTGRRSGPG